MRRLVLLTALLCPFAALAHDADLIYAQLQRAPGTTEVSELLTMTPATLGLLAPVDSDGDGFLSEPELTQGGEVIRAGVWSSVPLTANGAPCELLKTSARLREGYLELRGAYRCGPGELTQTFRILSVLPANYRVVLGSFVDGRSGERFAQGNEQTLIIEERGERISTFGGWLLLGVRHIFGGPDHIAFILAMALVATSFRRVLLMVTAFTVAHSITLGVTALGYVVLSPAQGRWVEAGIAASIVFVAVENVIFMKEKHRPVVTFLFGLVHGFGFAASLKGFGIEQQAVSALFGFNLGVEMGQAAIVIPVVLLVRLLQRRPVWWLWGSRLASLAVAAAGGYWFVDRLLG